MNEKPELNQHEMKDDPMHVQAPARFHIDAPLRYRPLGDERWATAETINISQSGVLFHCEELLPVGREVQLYLVLTKGSVEFPPLTICVGTVTRVVEHLADSRPAMAVQFVDQQIS